jgi:chromate transport protein ChrA
MLKGRRPGGFFVFSGCRPATAYAYRLTNEIDRNRIKINWYLIYIISLFLFRLKFFNDMVLLGTGGVLCVTLRYKLWHSLWQYLARACPSPERPQRHRGRS